MPTTYSMVMKHTSIVNQQKHTSIIMRPKARSSCDKWSHDHGVSWKSFIRLFNLL